MENTRLENRLSRLTHRFKRTDYFLAAVLLLSLVAAWPLLSEPGLLNTRGGGDSPFLLQRLQQLEVALLDGHFPVRWMPDANYGYGYPFYNFYAPLSIYITVLFRFFGFSYVSAIKLSQLAGFIVAGWSMYTLGRRWLGSRWSGLLAAAAYTLAPFHLVNVYVRGDSLAEFWAMAIYPIIFLAADQTLRIARLTAKDGTWSLNKIRKISIALLALAYGGLILSHNISALILSPFLLLFLFLVILDKPRANRPQPVRFRERIVELRWPILALILGLALSAWFWLPALAERSLAQLEPVTSGYFHFSNHFRAGNLVQQQLLFDYDVAGGQAFRMGLIQAVLVFLGLIAVLIPGSLLRRRGLAQQSNRPLDLSIRLFLVLGLAISTVMITPLSRFLWDQLPLLSFAQFPWRFLSVQAFFAALIIAALARLRGRHLFVPVIVLLMLIGGLSQLNPDFLLLSDEDVTSEKLAQYEWFSGNIGSTVSAEYLPHAVIPRPFTSPWLTNGDRDTVQDLDGTLSAANILERETTQQSWQFQSESQGTKVTVATIDWPDWQAHSSVEAGQAIALQTAAGSGLLMMALPAGDQIIDLELGGTEVRLVGELIALAALAIVVWLWLSSRPIRLRKVHGLLLLVLFLLFVILRLWPEKQLSAENLTWDFDQMAYLHHDQDGVPYDNNSRLLSYSFSDDEVGTGESVAVTLLWQGPEGVEGTLAMATPTINRFASAPLLVSQTLPLVEGENVYHLAIPQNSPVGLYIPRFTIEGARPLAPSGLTRGDLFLRPIRIIDTTQIARTQDRPLDARAIQVNQRDPNTLDVQLQWVTRTPLTFNYNFSLRLVDDTGFVVATLDNQPGYGFQPSSSWPAGEWVNDWLALPISPDLVNETTLRPLTLVVRLYDVATGDVVLVKPLGEVTWLGEELSFQANEPRYQLSGDMSPISADFGELIGLRGYKLTQTDQSLEMILYWQALAGNLASYSHFVHLVDMETGDIVAQHDGQPQHNNYPTNLWSINEIIADSLVIDLSEVAEGRYGLLIGLYQLQDGSVKRLPISAGQNIDDNALRLTDPVNID